MTMEIETARPLNPDPEVLDADWWTGLWCWTAPTIKELAESDDPRDVRKALGMAREARREIKLDVAKGSFASYVINAAPSKAYVEVSDTLDAAERAAEKMRENPVWKLLDAVEGKQQC